MRKVIAQAFVSLDGVMQAPGGPDEDRSDGFKYGGWQAAFWGDDAVGAAVDKAFSVPFDLLLGRKTYDIFAAYWPHVAAEPKSEKLDERTLEIANAFNRVTKYVATHSPDTLTWQNTQALGDDVAAAVRRIKQGDGADLLTQGSSDLLQTLLATDLVDELRLFIYPLVLGQGKRLFDRSLLPSTLQLTKSSISKRGVLLVTYQRAGEVKVGSFAVIEPTKEELERRQK
jgi:dihydrofolate reductase